MKNNEIDKVIELWLEGNITAHHYIPSSFWEDNKELVKHMMLEAEVYIYEDKKILGFVGLSGTYLAGIFVSIDSQSQGIGKKLLDYVKEKNDELQLNVYQKNTKAIEFYKRESFMIESESIDEETNEKELIMKWHK